MRTITIDIGPHLLALAILWSAYALIRLARSAGREKPDTSSQAANRAATGHGEQLPPAPDIAPSPARNLAPSPPPDPVIAVCTIVGARYGVSVEQLLSPSRAQPTALARQISMRLLRELTQLSYPQIGARFGRDHTTVIYALKATDGMLLEDLREDARAAIAPQGSDRPPREEASRDRPEPVARRRRGITPRRRRQAHAR